MPAPRLPHVLMPLLLACLLPLSVQAAPAVVVRPERWLTPCVAMSRAHLRSSIHQMPFLHPRSNRQWFNLEVR